MGEMAEWVGEESCSVCGCSYLELPEAYTKCDCECHDEPEESDGTD